MKVYVVLTSILGEVMLDSVYLDEQKANARADALTAKIGKKGDSWYVSMEVVE